MSTQIQFRSGHPQKFIATRSFSLGNSGMNITQGSELDFDGTHVSYAGSHPVIMPQLRGAVKAGWVVLAANYDPNDLTSSIPRPAGVQVREAKGGNPMDPPQRVSVTTASAEEREVGNVRSHAKGVQDRNTNVYQPQPGRRTASMAVEAQEGVTVRRLSTPTKQTTNFEFESPGEAISRANAVKIQAGEGRTREDLVAGMNEEEREEYFARIEAHRMLHAVEDDPIAVREREANAAILARRVVGQVASPKNAQREGFNIHNSVGGGIEIADASGMNGDIVESVTELEGMVFRNTNVGKPKPKPVVAASSAADVDTRRRIALAICPDFPNNYVFDDPVRKKIARLQADFDDRPDVIRAVAAADTDLEVRQRLMEEFPGAFA